MPPGIDRGATKPSDSGSHDSAASVPVFKCEIYENLCKSSGNLWKSLAVKLAQRPRTANPANVHAAIQHVAIGGHEAGPVYLLIRLPLQLIVIA